jgi:hypothetical protein
VSAFALVVKTGSLFIPEGKEPMIPRPTPRMSPELASKALALLQLGFNQHQAAAVLGVNQGRISEVKTGKRYIGAEPCDPDQLSFDL